MPVIVAAAGHPSTGGLSYSTLAAVTGLALAAPLLVQLRPSLRLPSAAAEIVLGIIVGPSGLGLIKVDAPVSILSELGLATLLFLAGLEIDTQAIRNGIARLLSGYAASVAIAVLAAFVISRVEHITSPLLVGFALAGSTVGMIAPILQDAGETGSPFGQEVLAATSIAEFGAIVLISMFFSQHASSAGSQVVLIALFATVAVLTGVLLTGLARSARAAAMLSRLERTTAQLGVRFAIAIVGGFAAIASALGLEAILAVFVAGVLLRLIDAENRLLHEDFHKRVDAIGHGFLIPIFFIATGLQLNFRAVFQSPTHLILVPVFVLGLLLARGLPALAYRRRLGDRMTAALALLQSASLPVIVIAANLGHELRIFDDATDAALVLAGTVSVIVFPAVALALIGPPGRSQSKQPGATATAD